MKAPCLYVFCALCNAEVSFLLSASDAAYLCLHCCPCFCRAQPPPSIYSALSSSHTYTRTQYIFMYIYTNQTSSTLSVSLNIKNVANRGLLPAHFEDTRAYSEPPCSRILSIPPPFFSTHTRRFFFYLSFSVYHRALSHFAYTITISSA